MESGDVRGFVKSEYITCDEKTAEEAEKKGEETYALTEELLKPDENKACYYTLTSVKTEIPQGEIWQSLLDFAAQFIGNPYVWGGTSLTEGADCSGFVKNIYKAFDYELPRTSREQSQFIEGQTIAVDPSVIPYGTQVVINGHVFTAEDCEGP